MKRIARRIVIFLLMAFSVYSLMVTPALMLETEAADNSKIILPNLISDHMLIQQNKPIKLWGTATAGKVIIVKLEDENRTVSQGRSTVKENGEFTVELPSVAAGGPYTLSFKTADGEATVNDVLVGELWIQSGQSNMERSTSRTGSYAREILPSETKNEIRLFMATTDIKGTSPATDLAGTWKIADASSVNTYSAVGYSALETLYNELNVPVGGICNAVGGANMGQFMGYNNDTAGQYYYSKTAPLTQLNVAGVMWYQGEGDRGSTPANFTAAFNKLIKTWRNGWNDDKLPFVYVTLPPSPMKYYASWSDSYIMEDFSSARLGQLQSYYENDNVAIAVTMDCPPNPGEDSLHPNNKKPIGERLGLAALDEIYKVIENGRSPLFGSVTVDGNTAVIKFNYTYDGLKTTDGMNPRCFYVSESENGKYYEAEAKIISADEISISCDKISKIRYVSYAVEKHMYPYSSADDAVIDTYADVNLVNSCELPACPFAYSVNESRSAKAPTIVTFEKTILLQIGKNTVILNDEEMETDVAPIIRNDRTMVPVRVVSETLGATVDWNDYTRTVTIVKDGTTISLTIDSATAYINSVEKTLDSAAIIENDRTYVPVAFISKAFGAKVNWDGETQTVTIRTN